MPFAELAAGKTYYEIHGPYGAPAVVFAHSLGASLAMWEPQVPALSRDFQVVRYDARGHGRSAAPQGPYRIEDLGRDVLELLEVLKIKRPHFCGISMGGLIALWLGIHAGEKLAKIAICNSAARIGTLEAWDRRIAMVRSGGMEAIAPALMDRWFTPRFRQREPRMMESIRAGILSTPVEGYLACCAAVRDADLREQAAQVRNQTLVICGASDSVTPPAEAMLLAGKIPGARYSELNGAHLSNIEAAPEFNETLLRFLAEDRKPAPSP